MFRPFKDLDRYFNGEISFDELIDSCTSEMEVGIRYIVENDLKEYDVAEVESIYKYMEEN